MILGTGFVPPVRDTEDHLVSRWMVGRLFWIDPSVVTGQRQRNRGKVRIPLPS
jgi:hypothetical protein